MSVFPVDQAIEEINTYLQNTPLPLDVALGKIQDSFGIESIEELDEDDLTDESDSAG